MPDAHKAIAVRSAAAPRGLGKHLLLSLFLSALVMLACFPQMYLRLDYSLIRFQDTEFLYFGLFQLVQNIAQGRVQLWNGYDQMPLAYFYLTGMMTYAHVLTAVAFTATQGLFDDTARYFYDISLLLFNFIPTVVRTIGLYLLVRLFTSHGPTILLSTVLGSSIFNPQFHLGLNCTPIYSLLPLAMYFSLRFLELFRLRDLLLGFLVVVLCVATNPLVGLGYFYQGLHFFLLSALCWCALSRWKVLTAGLRSLASRGVFLPLAGTLVLAAAIMLPWVWLLITTYPDYELAHATSRFAQPFTVLGYFDKAQFGANPWLFFTKQLDYSKNEWVVQWVFVGWICLIFALCGAVLSRDSRKYIFISTIVLFWLIQFPRNPTSVFGAAHWVNALTNPFSSVLRSAHMTGGFLLPTALVPLFALGLDRVWSLLAHPEERVAPRRAAVLIVALCAIVLAAVIPLRPWRPTTPSTAVLYIVAFGTLAAALLAAILFTRIHAARTASWAIACGFASILLGDIWASHKYFSQMGQQMRVIAHDIDGIPSPPGPLGLDFQNPLVTPVREHYANRHVGQVKPFFITDPNNMQGIFYRYTNLEKFFAEPSNYKPRHRSYAILATDSALKEYVGRDSRIAYIADTAVRNRPGVLDALLAARLDRRIVAIDAEDVAPAPNGAGLLGLVGPQPIDVGGNMAWAFRFSEARLTDTDAEMRRYALDLPPDFPRSLSSGVMTADRDSLELRLGGEKLIPAQGWLIRPLQFDLQNIRAGSLQFSVPARATFAGDVALELRYRSSTPLAANSIRKFEGDRIEFTVGLPRAGWMVWHHPFEPDWRVTVNGRPQRSYRANGAFVAFPLSAGQSVVAMEYRAGSPLRQLIPLSIVLNLVVLVGAMLLGYRTLRQSAAPAGAVRP